ncbi:MAG: DUF1476 domain-containing protein [Reyranellaceae bacterium]
MSMFDDREKGYEAKYKHDQEALFKITARRNKLLGLWVAEQLGKTGADAEAYAKDVVAADFEKPGDDDVIVKVLKDLETKGINLDMDVIRKKLLGFADVARAQVEAEAKK